MLEIKNISINFGGIKAVDKASMTIEEGKITGLIGPNGSGKSSLFNLISGNLKPTHGQVSLMGEDITALPDYEIFHKGVLRTFQLAHEFSNMTVLENLMVVPGQQTGESILNTWFKREQIKIEEEAIKQKALEVIEFLNLKHLTYELAGNLSGGQKKLLELGRTMMVDAKIVLLDEVGAGVNRTLLNDIADTIIKLNKEKNYTFFMIEHDVSFLSKLCDKVIVMTEGSVLLEGSIEEITQNEEVIEAYLGRGGIQ